MKSRKTVILPREMIREVITFGDYVEAVEGAFGRYAAGKVMVPEVVHIPQVGGAFHIKSAGFVDDPAYVAVKVNGNFPDNKATTGLPTIQGAITLCDGRNGFPLAIIDSIEVTAQRTAAATAVAAKYLADGSAHTATIIGCGVQGEIQLQAILHVLPIKKIFAFDKDAELCKSFAAQMTKSTGISVVPLSDFRKGTRRSQVIVTCTSARSWFLGQKDVQPGTFIAAVGSDNDDKQELDPNLLGAAIVVTDITDQCAHIGELHHALEENVFTKGDVYAELGEIVVGEKPAPKPDNNIIVFDSTGSAIQDVAAAGVIYERAIAQGTGFVIDFA